MSYSGVALASWQERLYLAWTGRDGRIRMRTSADGRHFSEPVELPYESYGPGPLDSLTMKSRRGFRAGQTFPLSPALAASRHGVDMAWRDSDRHIRVLRAKADGTAGEVVLRETSHVAPSLAVRGPEITLAWTGSDGHINVVASRGELFDNPIRLDHTSFDHVNVAFVGDPSRSRP